MHKAPVCTEAPRRPGLPSPAASFVQPPRKLKGLSGGGLGPVRNEAATRDARVGCDEPFAFVSDAPHFIGLRALDRSIPNGARVTVERRRSSVWANWFGTVRLTRGGFGADARRRRASPPRA